MEPVRWKLDATHSAVAIRTFAKGLLSPLAHDLEVVAPGASGDADEGDGAAARLRFPVAALRVAGVVKHGRLDARVLSDGDRAEIERRLRDEVFARGEHVEVEATLAKARVRATVIAPTGRCSVEGAIALSAEGEARVAEGVLPLSLAALGIPKVNGPMGMFRVGDGVEVRYRLVFRRG